MCPRRRKRRLPFALCKQKPAAQPTRLRLLLACYQACPGALYSCMHTTQADNALSQRNPLYGSPPVGSIHAAVWDISSDSLPLDLESESVDIAVLVFVLSALHPDEWSHAVHNIHRVRFSCFSIAVVSVDGGGLYVDAETWRARARARLREIRLNAAALQRRTSPR